MAALVASSKGGSDTTAITNPVDTTGANLIVIGVTDMGGAGTLSDSKGNTWTQLTMFDCSGSSPVSRIFYCENPTVGSGHTFQLHSASSTFPSLEMVAFSGAGVYDSGNTGANGGVFFAATSQQPGSITPGGDNRILVTHIGFSTASQPGSTPAINGGFTSPEYQAQSSCCASAIAYLIQTTAAAANPTWSWTDGANEVATMASFQSAASGPTLTQYRPGSDITDGSWTKSTGGNADLFSMLDEVTRDDSDYIQSAVNPSTDVCEIKFAGVQTPSATTDHSVTYVIKRDNGTALRVDLIDGSAPSTQIIKTWNHTGAGDTSFTPYTQSFVPSDGVGIVNYGDLRLRFTAG